VFLAHLKDHVKERTAIACPFQNCGKRFEGVGVTTFKSHISRFHRELDCASVQSKYLLLDSVCVPSAGTTCLNSADANLCDPENVQSVLSELSELDMEKLLVKKLAIFSMNLLANTTCRLVQCRL
jgi:hypothetical protein